MQPRVGDLATCLQHEWDHSWLALDATHGVRFAAAGNAVREHGAVDARQRGRHARLHHQAVNLLVCRFSREDVVEGILGGECPAVLAAHEAVAQGRPYRYVAALGLALAARKRAGA